MANDTVITVVGNLTADPNLRYTQSGAAVADFTVASTPRTYDKQSNQFKDGDTLFLRCSVWRDYAENVAESLAKGMQVIVQGRLVQRSYEKDGQQRTSIELQVEEVGPTLRWVKAQVQRAGRSNGQQSAPQASYQAPASDPWGSPAETGFPIDGGTPSTYDNSAPF